LRKKSLKKILSVAISLLVVFTITGCSLIQSEYEYADEEFIMNTFISIRVYADNKEKAKEAVQKAFQEFKRIEELTNRFVQKGTAEYEKSEINIINLAAGQSPVLVSEETFKMLSLSKKYNKELDGVFDITIGPLVDLWGFGQEKNNVPGIEQLKSKLDLVDSNSLILDEHRQTAYLKKTGMSLDLGAIAKGYATEKAAQVIREYGIEKAIINAGGNIYALGEKGDGIPWKIGIQDPRDANKIFAILNLKDQVAVTSGDYQRYFEVDGTRYHHILDPRTGKPADELMSVTVIGEDSTIADILSTSFFILGVDKSLAYINEHPGIEAVFVTKDKKIYSSVGVKDIIEFKENGGYIIDER